MLQGPIVIKVFTQIGIEEPAYTKYAITDFHLVLWILISVNVTIYRTDISLQGLSK